jgi:N-acylglucosamine 2-epimerase
MTDHTAFELERKQLLEFYRTHVTEQLLPFWHRAVDEVHGGVYTCFNNAGTRLVSTDKYTWSQGRFVWLWAKMADLCRKGLLTGDADTYLQQARKTVRFLSDRAVMDNGHCAYVLTEAGIPKELEPGQGYDASFYADCFVVLGFSQFAKVTGDREVMERALLLLSTIKERLNTGTVRSEPYPIPSGFTPHAVPMIMLNVVQEAANALEAMGNEKHMQLRKESKAYMESIMGRFREEDIIVEMIPDHESLKDTLLHLHTAPGHTLESMWFVIEEAVKTGRQDLIKPAVRVIKKAYELGWDRQHGGLFRFTHKQGGRPEGRRCADRYERLIEETWDMKIWWPHSEALYTAMLAYRLTGDAELLSLYERTHDYTFRVFPNPDRTVGEWIQIRDRTGRAVDKTVALPVKDPFHILRNFLKMIELLDQEQVAFRI